MISLPLSPCNVDNDDDRNDDNPARNVESALYETQIKCHACILSTALQLLGRSGEHIGFRGYPQFSLSEAATIAHQILQCSPLSCQKYELAANVEVSCFVLSFLVTIVDVIRNEFWCRSAAILNDMLWPLLMNIYSNLSKLRDDDDDDLGCVMMMMMTT